MGKPESLPSRAKMTRGTLAKAPTGISGLDEITLGGLPRGRPTLICGSAGCGKTLFGMEFLLRGALDFDEPGVFMAFEETEKDLSENVRSLGFDLDKLVAQNKIAVDYVHVERSEIQETGEYDLDLVLRDELVEVEAERAYVRGQVLLGFLEGHEHAGLVEIEGPAQQKLHGEEGLAAARAAANERGPAARQAAERDLVEPGDSSRCFSERIPRRLRAGRESFGFSHWALDT
jgi:hypothetical protein